MRTVFLFWAVALGGGCNEAGNAIEGTWVLERPDCTEQFVFHGGGTYGNDRSGCSSRDVRISGTYTLGEDSIALTGTDAIGGEHARITSTYYLAENHLALWALLPQGMVDGILGTWEGSYKWEYLDDADGVTMRSGGTTTIMFAAGGDCVQTYAYFGSTDSSVMAGTWTEQADGTFETLYVGGDTAVGGTVQLVDGAALGGLFERQ